METVQKDVAVPGLTIRAGTPLRVVAENMRDLIAENNDLASISTESRLYRAVLALATQSGTPVDEIVRWLCDGGLAQMALSHFAAAQSQPLVEPTADAKDAARYRWLRDHANDYERDGAMVILHEHDEDNKDRPHWVLCNAALDETIDSALAAPPQQHQVKKGEPS